MLLPSIAATWPNYVRQDRCFAGIDLIRAVTLATAVAIQRPVNVTAVWKSILLLIFVDERFRVLVAPAMEFAAAPFSAALIFTRLILRRDGLYSTTAAAAAAAPRAAAVAAAAHHHRLWSMLHHHRHRLWPCHRLRQHHFARHQHPCHHRHRRRRLLSWHRPRRRLRHRHPRRLHLHGAPRGARARVRNAAATSSSSRKTAEVSRPTRA